MNFADKKTIMIAGGVAAVAVILLLVFVVGGRKGHRGANAGAGMGAGRAGRGAQTGQTAGTPTPGRLGATRTGAGAETPAGGGAPPAAGGEQAAAGPSLFGSVATKSGHMAALTRVDPLINFEAPPPQITPEERTPLPSVTVVAGGLRVTEPSGITETIADRRVAGVKFNGGAWAILVSDRDSFVVKPGDVIEGTKIAAISRDSIYIVDPDGEPWQVPLRGAGPGGGASAATVGRISGMPEGPPEGS